MSRRPDFHQTDDGNKSTRVRFRQPRELRLPGRASRRWTTAGPAAVSMTVFAPTRSTASSTFLFLLAMTGSVTWTNDAGGQTPDIARSPVSQTTSPRTRGGCPGGRGIHISLTSGDTAGGVDRIIDGSRPIDTTIVFNIAERSWTRTNLAAAISVGLADEAGGGYMICAGVTALMPSATLTIRGARGRVHFQASLAELTSAIRLAPGAGGPQPRRL